MVLQESPQLTCGSLLAHLASNRERCSLRTANTQHRLFWTRVITGSGAFPPSQPAKLHQIVGPEPISLRKKCQVGKAPKLSPCPRKGRRITPRGKEEAMDPIPGVPRREKRHLGCLNCWLWTLGRDRNLLVRAVCGEVGGERKASGDSST